MAYEVVRSEVQVIRTQSTATNASMDTISGNFRLSWGEDGEETDYLPADVGEVELEAALEGLQDIRDVQVKRKEAHHGCIKQKTNYRKQVPVDLFVAVHLCQRINRVFIHV